MKVYIISEISYQYNDEYCTQEEVGNPQLAFKSKEKAEAKLAEMNAAAQESNEDVIDCEGNPFEDFYTITELEIE